MPLHPVRRLGAATSLLVLSAGALAAQRAPQMGTSLGSVAEVTPYAGVVRFGTLLDGPLGTSLRPSVSPLGGAQLALHLAPNVSLLGNVAYGSGDLKVGVPLLGGLDVGSSSAWLYDAGLEVKLPTMSTVVPFLQAGAGAMTSKLSSGPVSTTSTDFAWNAGGGVDLALGRSLGLRVLVKDYVSRFDAGSIGDVTLKSGTTHNVAATAGLRFAF